MLLTSTSSGEGLPSPQLPGDGEWESEMNYTAPALPALHFVLHLSLPSSLVPRVSAGGLCCSQ